MPELNNPKLPVSLYERKRLKLKALLHGKGLNYPIETLTDVEKPVNRQ